MRLKTVFIVLVFFAFAAPVFAESPVLVGRNCNFTFQCDQGYCDNSSKVCIVPSIEEFRAVGNCTTSRNCSQGFCVQGQCVLPSANTTRFVVVGPKAGCAGLIEFCTPIIPFCYQLCEGIWVLLVLTAIVAGVAARNEKNKLVPMLLFVMPIVVGFVSFAFLGVLIAITEILLSAYRARKERTGLEELEFKELSIEELSELPELQEETTESRETEKQKEEKEK